MKRRHHRRALIETFESRLLYSADPGPAGIVTAVLAAPIQQSDGAIGLQDQGTELVFVDARTPDVQQLIDDLAAQQQAGRRVEVIVVGADEDGIGRIGSALSGRDEVSAIHVVGHGASGTAQLGASTLDAESIFQRAGEIAAWGDALTGEADLLLYGCDVGDGASGRSLVASLAQLTGADVAASDDPTGSALYGGDWQLEVRSGTVEALPFASADLQFEWAGTLALTAQGSETLVNTSTSGTQTVNWSSKTVAMDANGNYVIIWMDGSGASDTGIGIYGQRYNASGVAQGAQFHVNTYTFDNQRDPQVAMDASGNFVVVWESTGQDGSSNGIYAQRYNSSGVVQGSEFRVNSTTTYDQLEPAVAMDASGNFVIAWQSWSQDLANSNGIYAQRYNSSGVAQGGEFLVNTYTTDSQTEPSVAMDASGNFVIAWQSFGQDGSNEGIYAKRYNSSGVVQGSEFHVSTYTTSNQDLPVVAMDTSGNFVIVWESGQDGSGNGIYGQRYNSSGVAQGGEFRINTTTADQQQNPVVTMLASGGFVVTWQSMAQDGSFDGVYMRQYDSSGTALTGETLVNTTTTGYQDVPSIASDEKGHLVVVWHGDGTGDSDGVFMRRYLYAAAPVITPTGYSGTYVENAGAIYDAGATVTDSDTTVLNGGQLIYQVIANGTATDELGIRNQGTGAGQIGLSGTNVTYGGTTIGTYSGSFGTGSTPLTVTFNSNASVAAVQALVRNITYRNTSENPSTATRSISLTVSDGTGMTSTPAVVTMAVSAVNDAPVITSLATANVAENTTAVLTVTSSDVDGGTPTYTLSGGVDQARFSINSSTGALSFLSAPNYESPTDTGSNNVYDVTVQVSDGAGGTTTQSIAVSVTPVNDNTPVITSGATANVAENTTAVMTVTATDADLPAQTLTYSIVGGADAAKFAINSSTGALSFATAQNYEAPTDVGSNNVYDVTVQATDGTLSSTKAIAVTVTAVNDNTPAITSGATANVAENSTAVMTVTATDADLPAQTLTYSIVGGADAAKFAINASTGALSFLSAPNFEVPTDSGADNVYDVTVQAADGAGGTTSQAVAVTVTNVNEAPTITITITPTTYATTEQTPLILSGTSLSVADVDAGAATIRATLSVISGTLTVGVGTTGVTLVSGSGSASVVLEGSQAQLNDLLAGNAGGTISYIFDGDAPPATDTLSLNVNDLGSTGSGGAASGADSATINLTAVNDAPVNTIPGSQTTSVNTALTFGTATGNPIAISDADAASATLQVSLTITNGTFTLSSTSGLSFTTGDGTGDAAMTFTGTIAAINAALDGASFIPITTYSGDAAIAIVTSDLGNTGGGALTDSDTIHIQVGASRFQEGVSGYTGTQDTYVQDNTPSTAYGTTTTVLVDDGAPEAQGLLRFDNLFGNGVGQIPFGATITSASLSFYVTHHDAADTVYLHRMFSAWTEASSWNSLGSGIQTNNTEASTTATLSFSAGVSGWNTLTGLESTVQAWADGATNNGWAFLTINPGADNWTFASSEYATVSLRPYLVINYEAPIAPVITSNGGGASASVSIAENTSAVTTVTATDADSTASELSYSIVGGADAAKFTINSTTGALSFLAAPNYESPTDAGGNNVYDVTVQVSDGFLTDTQAIAVTVTPVNDNTPAITSSATANVAENSTAVMTVTATDADQPAQTLTYSIAGGADAAKFSINSSTGALSFVTAPDYEAPTDAGGNNVYDVTVQASDGTLSSTKAIAVTVTAVNDNTPVITSGATANVAENTTAVMTVTATDADLPAQTLTYSIVGGADAAKFSINASTGALSFATAPDYEAPTDVGSNNVYDVTVQASDGTLSSTKAIAVTVTAANDNTPTITSGATASVAENTTAVMTVTATDADLPAQTLTYSIVGGADAAKFAINSSTGALSFVSAPDFETPTNAGGDNIYDVTVQASDGTLSSTKAIAVTVTAANDNTPVITSGATASVAENTTAVMTVTATDADLPAQTLTYSIVGGADAAKFSINSSTGALSFVTAPDYEAPTDAGGNNVYDVTVQASDGTLSSTKAIAVTVNAANDNTPTITSGATASVAENTTAVMTVTATDADQPAQTLSYSIIGGTDAAKFAINSSTGALSFLAAPNFETPTDAGGDNVYDVTVQASDGTLSSTKAIAVTVTAANDNTPVITSGATASVAENTTAVMTVTATDADLPAQTLTYSIVGGADAAKFAINASTGALSFATAPDYEVPTDAGGNNVYDVTVQATDGTLSSTKAIAVTVTAANDNTPVITSSATASVAENTTAVMTVTATDADLPAQTLTYSIVGGADAAKFSINSGTGALSFVTAPNYEAPTDVGSNNVYDVTVQASDGTLSSTKAIAVTVTAANDNTPVITSGATASVAENTTAVMTVTATDADLPAQTLTYSIVGGADAAKFAINASTGALSFATAPDYEVPTDAGSNNVYDVTVQASDGTLSSTKAITVTVTAVNESPPVITSNGGGASASVSIAENTLTVASVTATDADLPASSFTYDISGGVDAAKFTIDANSGVLQFVSAPDFENPTDSGANNVYNLTVRVSDGTNTDTQSIAVTVTNVASELIVTTAADTADGNTSSIANLVANKGADGRISLREAIIAANNTAGSDIITFAIGSGAQTINLSSALPTITSVIQIQGDSQPGFTGEPLIALNGASAGASSAGLVFSGAAAAGGSVKYLAINNFTSSGIQILSTSNITVAGNYLGTNLAGTAAAGNEVGVLIFDSANNTIGGSTAATRNVISGNTVDGVQIFGGGATGNVVAGNFIGLDATGTADLGNTNQGVAIFQGATYNTVGGTTAGARNVISGNDEVGVRISDSGTNYNTISGNYIGTNAAGSGAVGNTFQGVQIDAGSANLIGGTVAGAGNVISGNLDNGILITNGGVNNYVQGNIIGLDAAGNTTLANTQEGIEVTGGAYGTWIGGTTSATRNIISGNAWQGIGVYGATTDGTVIRGNWIGVAADGTTAAGNEKQGILVMEATNTMIGGSNTGEGNVIANARNFHQGIVIDGTATGAVMIGNSIYANGSLGIDVGGDWINTNDVGDTDTGANNLQNTPVLTSALTTGSAITIVGTLNSLASTNFRIEFFANPIPDSSGHGEGQSYLGFVDVVTNASGNASFSATLTAAVPTGQVVTATATRLTSGMAFIETSEFAANIYTNPPSITSEGGGVTASVSVAENTTTVSTVTASDPDGAAQTLTYSIVGGADAGHFAINGSTGALSFQVPPNFEVPTDTDGNNTYNVTVQVADGTGAVDTQAITVSVTNSNDAPLVTFVAGNTDYPENAGPVIVAALATVADEDGGDFNNGRLVVQFTANGQAEDRIAIRNQGTGAGLIGLAGSNVTYGGVVIGTWAGGTDGSTPLIVTFNASADATAAQALGRNITYENVSENPTTLVRTMAGYVEDGDGGTSNVASGTVTLIPSNDAPIFTSSAAVNVAENSTAVTTITSSDPDGGVPAYAIVGGTDAAKFAINSSTGALSFLAAPDFEAPTDAGGNNVYNVTVQVADGQGGTNSQAIAVTVTSANDNAPVITSGATASVAENTTAVMTVTATDSDQPAQTLSFSIVGGADAAKFAINSSTGALSFLAAPDFETPTDAGGDNVYDVTVQVSDGQGGTDSQAIAVTVISANDNAPVITSGATASVAENTTAVMTVTATDADLPAQTLTYSIVGGADAAKFAINSSTGALSFLAAPDFETPTDAGGDNVYDVTVQVSDGQGSTDSQAIAVTVISANDNAPVITSGATANAAENTTAVMTVTATDADQPAQTLSFSIVGGADATKFAINSSTGALSFISAPDFETPTDAGGDNVYDVTIQVSDGQGGTDSQAIAVTVTAGNDNAPVISSGATASVAENTTAVMTVTATDSDQPAQTLSFSIVGGADAAKFTINASTGALSFISAPDFETPTDAGGDNVYDVTVEVSDGQGGTDSQAIAVTVTAGNDNAPVISSGATASVAENTTAVMTVTATDSDQPAQTLSYSIIGGADASKFTINANTGALSFLAAPDFETPTDAGGDNVYDVTVEVADGQGSTDSQAIAVTVTAGNDNAPVITSGATASVAENTTAVMTVTATDVDQPAQTLSFSIVGGADAGKFTINASTGALSFVSAPDFETPTDAGGDNVYDVTVEVADGQGSTDSQAIAVTVTSGNDNAPVITSGATASVAENTTAVMTVTATDADQPAQTLSFSIAGGADAAKFAIKSSTGALSFISAPDFETPTDAGGNNVYDVTVQVSDGQGSTNSLAIAVTVTAGNDNAPVITSGATASVAENTTAVMTVTATDSDQPAQTLSFSIVGGADAAKFAINSSTGALSFISAPDFETPTDAGGDNVYDVTVQVSDGQGSTDSQAIAVTVTSGNDNAPVITSGATASVAENTTAVMTVTATDADQPAQTLSYSIIGGADAAKFTINTSTGALSFISAPDFETPTDAGGDNVYDVTVQVSDGQGSTDSQAIAVTVTAGNDNAPVITSGATASVAENTTAVMTVTATDSDQPAQTLSYSIIGGADAAKFTINASTGALSFISAPDFETPTDASGDNVYDVTVQVSDGQGSTDSQAIAVTVTSANDNAPVITSGATASVAENTTAVMTVTATDADQPAQTLSFSIIGGADAAKFAINASTGALSFVSAPDFESPTDAGGDNVYDVTVQVADGQGSTDSQAIAVTVTSANDSAPVITSGATASVAENTTAVMTVTATDSDQPAQTLSFSIIGGADAAKFTINASTGALSFVSAPDFEVPTDAGGNNVYDVTVQVSDGQGSTDSQAIAVTVTSANDNAPVITSGATASVAENTTAVMTVTATDADQPAQTLSFSIAGGADAAKFTINANTGALSFISAPDFETPTDAGGDNVYDVTVEVADGQGSTDSQAIAVTVTSANDNAPVITSSATASVAENTTAVMTVTATDVDQPAQTLSFSIVGGADAGKFTINASTGALSFVSAPDFETPTDAGGDNVYDVTVQVSDGQGSTDSQAIAVTVTSANDNAPVITSGATASVAENTTAVMTVTATDADQPAQTLSFSIAGGADAAKFAINSSTGALSFISAPDFETPTDAGGDNVYDVTVQVSDGQGGTDSQAIAVTVTAGNDNAPVITSGTTASVAENTTAVMTVTATDADQPAQTLSFSIVGGADAGKFTINSSTGALSFLTAPDFETPTDAGGDNVYDVTVQVADGQGSTDSLAIAVTVTAGNDNAPVITSGATASIAENTTAVMTVTATDTDQPAQTLSFSITGGADAARFAIDAVSGALRFVSPPDFEQSSDADGDNVYEVVVSVSDGTLDTATSLTISVIGLSEAPHGSDGSIRLNEDESYVFSTADFGFSDPGDNHADLLAAVQIVGLPARGMLSLDGRSVTDGEWVAAVDIASGLLRYVPPADENGLPFTSLGFRVRDDGGTANGGADTEAGTHVLTIGVNPLSDAPIGKNDSYVLDEDGFIQLENGGVLANDTDPDGLPLSAELVSGPANGQLTLESNGSFRFTPDADWNGVDGFSYRPSNGQEVGDIVRVTLTVTPVNDAPTLVKASFPLTAGGAVTLGADAIQATDKDSPQSALVYEVVRTENGHFELTSAPGKAVSAFSHADLLAGRVVFHHQAFADRPVVVLRAGDGQSMGPELEASVAFSPAGSISTSPLPSYETQPDSGVANPSQGTTGAVKPPARPAAPSTLAPLQVFPEVAKAGDDGHSLHLTDGVKTEAVARRSSLESQARFSRAQITLTLGTQPDGALMEFMLGTQDPAKADTGSTASRAVSDRSKTAPLSEPYADVQLVLHAVELSGIVLTAGAVWWASRASGLIAGLLMVAPAWRTFDPLPVLGPVDDSEKDWGRRMDDEMTRDEIGVADLFDQEREGWVR